MTTPGYLLLDGTGDYSETSDKAALDITGDLEMIWVGEQADGFSPGPNQQALVTKKNTASDFRLAYQWYLFDGPGPVPYIMRLRWKESDNSTVNEADSTANLSVITGDHAWLRVTLDVSVYDVNFYYSNDPIDTPVGSVSWTQLGATVTGGGATDIIANTAPLTVGASNSGAEGPFDGKVYGASVYDGIGGTQVANPDWRDDDQGWSSPPGTDDEVNEWSLEGDAEWVPPVFDISNTTPRAPRYGVTRMASL